MKYYKTVVFLELPKDLAPKSVLQVSIFFYTANNFTQIPHETNPGPMPPPPPPFFFFFFWERPARINYGAPTPNLIQAGWIYLFGAANSYSQLPYQRRSLTHAAAHIGYNKGWNPEYP